MNCGDDEQQYKERQNKKQKWDCWFVMARSNCPKLRLYLASLSSFVMFVLFLIRRQFL